METRRGLPGALRGIAAVVADEYLRRHFDVLSSSMHARQITDLGLVVVENGMLRGRVTLTPHEPSLVVVDAPSALRRAWAPSQVTTWYRVCT